MCGTTVLTADSRTNDIQGLPVGGYDVRKKLRFFRFTVGVISSEVENLMWFSFDLALKLALYWSVLEN